MNEYMMVLLAPAFFVGLWIGICLLLSWIGGWWALARHYRSSQTCMGERFSMQSAGMRWGVSYRTCMNFGADPTGLYLSVFPLFRIGQPPLFIPWSDISFSREKWWFMNGVRLRFREVPDVPLFISTKLATGIFAHGPLRFEAA